MSWQPYAQVYLPSLRLPGGDSFNTLRGYWQPPAYVTEWWTFGAKFPWTNEKDYVRRAEEVKESQRECVAQFWREWAL